MKRILQTLFDGRSLDRAEASRAMGLILSGETPPEQIAACLGALRAKTESLDELVGFAQALKDRAVRVPVKRKDIVDTCGTGGDGAETFNISTAVAFVVAGAGVAVTKHGNRSVSSRCGSADVLEALGVNIQLGPKLVARSIDEVGFGFLFAPAFHPLMKYPGAVRKVLGVRTVFNLLGPLVNPTPVKRQVVGVYDPTFLVTMAEVLKELGSEEALIVCGHDGLDEITLTGPTRVAHLKEGTIRRYDISPEDAGLRRAALQDLKGGDAVENARLLREVLEGRPGPKRDIVALNAAAALMVSGVCEDLRAGVDLAMNSITTGRALTVLEEAKRIV